MEALSNNNTTDEFPASLKKNPFCRQNHTSEVVAVLLHMSNKMAMKQQSALKEMSAAPSETEHSEEEKSVGEHLKKSGHTNK